MRAVSSSLLTSSRLLRKRALRLQSGKIRGGECNGGTNKEATGSAPYSGSIHSSQRATWFAANAITALLNYGRGGRIGPALLVQECVVFASRSVRISLDCRSFAELRLVTWVVDHGGSRVPRGRDAQRLKHSVDHYKSFSLRRQDTRGRYTQANSSAARCVPVSSNAAPP